MTASNAVDVCRFTAASSGTGDFTYSAAVTGYQSPSAAGITNGQQYSYRAETADLSQWEVGTGTYNTSTGVLTRTSVLFNSSASGSSTGQSGVGSKISFSAAPQVAIVLLVEDLPCYCMPQGRLTLQSGVGVMTTTQSAKTTLYYTPYAGSFIPINNGSGLFVPASFTELSAVTTDTTKSPAAITGAQLDDWFVWNDAGTLRFSHGPDWTNETTRGSGTALLLFSGVWVNNTAITNGPAAGRGTYVGTTRSDASSKLNWILGTGGTAGDLAVWNAYNRRQVATSAIDTTSTWTYSSATVRQARASAANQIGFVSGLAEDAIVANLMAMFNLPSATTAFADVGLALDSTTVFDKRIEPNRTNQSGTITNCGSVTNIYQGQLGYHRLAALEAGDGTNTTTFIGGSAFQGLSLVGMM